MADTKKITETMVLETLKAVVTGAEAMPYEDVYVEDCVEWIDKKLAQKVAKAEKAKEQRAQKAKENDELLAKVQDLLTDDFQTAQAITDALADPEISKAKVQYRLTVLVKDGVATKETRKVEKSTVTVYKLA